VSILLAFLLFVSVLVSISFGVEKGNSDKKLKEAQANLEEQRVYYEDLLAQATTEQVTQPSEDVPADVETFRVYIVQQGDCLEKICEKYNLNYMENIQSIMKINGIKDVNIIYIGQKLYLPMGK